MMLKMKVDMMTLDNVMKMMMLIKMKVFSMMLMMMMMMMKHVERKC